jgi:hypothetical protein
MSTLAEQMIEHYKDQFDAANVRKSKTVFTVAGRVGVATPGEKVIYLPNGVGVKVTTDASGTATQVEEDESLHAIVRPKSFRVERRYRSSTANIGQVVHPHPIRAASNATRPGG